MMPSIKQNSCVSCSRRKIKCDKLSPCSNCSKTRAQCVYRAPPPSQRHRKRLTQGDLLAKIQELETLLHSHKIPFDPLGNSWIQSPWEKELAVTVPLASPSSSVNASSSTTSIEASPTVLQSRLPNESTPQYEHAGSARLWAGLSDDLKTPMISQLKGAVDHDMHDMTDQPTSAAAVPPFPSLIISAHLHTPSGLLELHPNPRHVFKLWQSFAENVNPLTKIIHAPTLQDRVLKIAWDVETATKPLEATMFAVYALAVSSMKPVDCLHAFEEDKESLISRYRTGALRALSYTELLSTRDIEVLQALALVLMIDRDSELSTSAVALAMRIGHKMGLHRAGEDSSISFFEQEMRIRLWWYIRGLNSRVRREMGLPSSIDDLESVRLPMNVNDADLHPRMSSPPTVQHTAATEMVYCLMKYDMWNFVRRSPNFSGSVNPREKAQQLVRSSSPESMAKKKKVHDEVNHLLQDKYLQHLDTSIPLQYLSAAIANITIHKQRFQMFHPRHQPEAGKHMSSAEQDLVFESSVRILELDQDVRGTNFSMNLVDHMTCRAQVEALVYMVSELRHRTSGRMVETGWKLLEELHDDQPEVLQGPHEFYTALGDLTLEAWDARRLVLDTDLKTVPKFINMLQLGRGKASAATGSGPGIIDLQMTSFTGSLSHEEALDWSYWDTLLEQSDQW